MQAKRFLRDNFGVHLMLLVYACKSREILIKTYLACTPEAWEAGQGLG